MLREPWMPRRAYYRAADTGGLAASAVPMPGRIGLGMTPAEFSRPSLERGIPAGRDQCSGVRGRMPGDGRQRKRGPSARPPPRRSASPGSTPAHNSCRICRIGATYRCQAGLGADFRRCKDGSGPGRPTTTGPAQTAVAYASTFGAEVSAGRAAFAVATSAAKVAGSVTARSARMRRSTPTPARFRPWMRRL